MLPDFGFWNNFFWSLTVCSTTGFIIKPVLAKGCKFEGNKRAINQNWFIFASLHYEDQVSPSTRCYLENLCSVYQLCQLFPGRQHIHKTICVCRHQRATPAEYICPPLKWLLYPQIWRANALIMLLKEVIWWYTEPIHLYFIFLF